MLVFPFISFICYDLYKVYQSLAAKHHHLSILGWTTLNEGVLDSILSYFSGLYQGRTFVGYIELNFIRLRRTKRDEQTEKSK